MAKTNRCIFLDFETRSKRPIEDGAFAYAADDSTDILCTGYAIEDEPAVAFPMRLVEQIEHLNKLYKAINQGYAIVAHNILFEFAIKKYVGTKYYAWPQANLSNLRCTMQMAGRAGLPLSLGDCAKALNITQKLESGKALLKLFSIPQKDGTFVELDDRPREKEKLLEYCRTDVEVCRDIWRNLPEWKELELEDVLFDLECNTFGVPVDVKTSNHIYKEVLSQQAGFATRVNKLTGGVITKMTQAARIKNWMKKYVNESVPNGTAETVQEILDGKYGEVDEVSQEILEMRQHSGKSSTGKYLRYVNSSVRGRIHGMIISFGAHTGRPVSKLLNLYNLPKPSIKYSSMDILVEDLIRYTPEMIEEKYGSYLKAASTAIRGMIEANDNRILCVSDYAAIEARIVFWLASCMLGLKLYRDGIDPYIQIATRIFNKAYHNITDEERWVGKQVILGAGYGLGPQGFVNSCARWGVEVSFEIAEESIYAYRNEYPEVVELWNSLEEAALLACRSGKVTYAAKGLIAFKTMKTKSGIIMLQMKLPSGRCINYPDVRIETVRTPWGAKKKAITYKKVTNGGYFRESTYGGKIAENAVQGIARDIMYYGAKQAKKNEYDILFTVYDEVIALADKSKANIEEFNELLCSKPDWAHDLPLEAEGELLKRYQKLK